jgi:hypothetical protein
MARKTSRKAPASRKASAPRGAQTLQAAMPPKATAVEVVPAQPTDADRDAIAFLGARANRALPGAAYLVLVELKVIPPATSEGWALYVGDFRVPKYWEYKDGIYFKVFDPEFFAEHKGERLRFSQDEQKFIDTGLKLAAPAAAAKKTSAKARALPRQEDVLK